MTEAKERLLKNHPVIEFLVVLISTLLAPGAISTAAMWLSVNAFTWCSVRSLGGIGAGGGFSIGIDSLFLAFMFALVWLQSSLIVLSQIPPAKPVAWMVSASKAPMKP
ncbi:hypothetical protein [Thauera butanivorans]|uniref:hypothetical protein n=1 Tax=Thauera butanivorans TaxID=86174 RepID=UPI00083989CF|nr:hypothetical protein [Thauera butanivorans]